MPSAFFAEIQAKPQNDFPRRTKMREPHASMREFHASSAKLFTKMERRADAEVHVLACFRNSEAEA
jgi:hypothetical protein